MTTPITVAYGDGIGPEIMEATLHVLKEAGADIAVETIEVGERVYNMGATSGILPSAWETLRRNKVLLKSPITTPQGKGYKSLNVTMRKTLGLYANIRPTQSYHPFVKTPHPKMNMVIVRENEEDLYAGIEYRQSQDCFQSLKVITCSGSERIIRYAFEYAVQNGRKKVTCMSKDNIMKMADGLFHRLFDEIGAEYPQLTKEHYIIDIGAARIAAKPEIFDVIVTENLYGDIISDIAAEVSGSVGLAGSSNIGEDFAMFEAIHGSAPDIAGKNIANPSGILQSAVMMLVHIGQPEVAARIQNAWLVAIESGLHTPDIYREGISKEKLGTKEFAKAVISCLGKTPSTFPAAVFGKAEKRIPAAPACQTQECVTKKELIGVDVYIQWAGDVNALGNKAKALETGGMTLENLSNKGLKAWPDADTSGMHLTDQYRCRFRAAKGKTATHGDIAALIARAGEAGFDFTKTENLYLFDGAPGFTLGQGE
ncbi:MAG: NADP-dependent isocitrate dehydrogenase [Pseudomonadota bacterium]|nr:NADP-dependent isocitrate dehydrogenase [Pseudomonadota bacterium]